MMDGTINGTKPRGVHNDDQKVLLAYVQHLGMVWASVPGPSYLLHSHAWKGVGLKLLGQVDMESCRMNQEVQNMCRR